MSASTRTALVAALGVALLALAWALHARGDLLDHAGDYVLLAAGMLAVCAAGTSLLWRRASQRDVVIVLVVALAARAVLAFDAPTLSNDVYRFAWDGRVQAAGTNPYRYAPADEALRALRDGEVFPRLNRPRTRTLYPPANEVFYVAAHEAGGYSVRSVKLALLAIEAVVVALLLVLLRRARLSPGRVVLYAWQPLAIVEIAASGHSEPLLIALTLAALLAWDARAQLTAGLALGAAALTKFAPALVAPFFFRTLRWRFAAAFAGIVALLYAPYLNAGTAALGSLSEYADEGFGAGPFRWLTVGAGLPEDPVRVLLLTALAGAALLAAYRPPRDLVEACRYTALLFAGALLAGHLVLPWYALWLLPLLCVAPVPALLWVTSTISVYFLTKTEELIAQDVASVVVRGPTIALLVYDAVRARRRPAQPRAEIVGAT